MEKISKAELDEKIEKLPVFEFRDILTPLGDKKTTKKSNRFTGIVNIGNDVLHSCVSDRYVLMQFKDLFEKVTGKFKDYQGNVFYHDGYAVLVLFPENQNVGLYVINSVNKSASVFIRFVVNNGGLHLVVPKLKQFKQIHAGEKFEFKIDNFSEFVSGIESEWNTILTKLKNTELTAETIEATVSVVTPNKEYHDMLQGFFLNNKIKNFWDLFVEMVTYADMIKAKSDVKKFKTLERISDALYMVCMSVKV